MAEMQMPDLSALMKEVAQKPELLEQAMQVAKSLKSSGILSGLTGGIGESSDRSEDGNDKKNDEDIIDRVPEKKSDEAPRYAQHRAFLSALRPYLSEERRQRTDMLIRLLGIMAAADKMGLGKQMGGSNDV